MSFKKIGIIGGMSPASTSDYYDNIINNYYKLKKDLNYPEIFIHSIPFKKIINKNYKDTKLIIKSINALKLMGADFVIASCNSIHVNFNKTEKKIKIPWISITTPTVKYIKSKKIKKTLLLGTKYTLKDNFFCKDLKINNIKYLLPTNKEMLKINRIIYNKLIFKKISKKSENFFLKILTKYKKNGIKDVILGCTELSYAFISKKKFKNYNFIDTSKLHSEYALNYSMNLLDKN